MLLHLLIIVTSCLFCVNTRICPDVSARNTLSSFTTQLQGCTVVAGNLELMLIEKEHEDNFAGLSFPELTEIRGYVLIFRIFRLTTLSHIFPNLTIIRGVNLFQGYSFVLHDIEDMTEIGLPNLKYILRGSTRIEYCPELCYVNTVNWTIIGGPSHKLDHVNNNQGLCGDCPEKCKGLCWNQAHCQKLPQKNCHPECLECTQPNAPDKCIACRNYRTNGKCVGECPNGKVGHAMTVSCLTHLQCISQPGIWWPFEGKCIDRCPPNYTKIQKKDQNSCEFCGAKCRRTCPGIELDSSTKSSLLHGCTHIDGSLAIRTDCDEVKAAELYNDLEMIEEIDGYLKIHRARALTSLRFLKNLKIIHGNSLHNGKHVLIAFENPNLRKLWDHNHTIEVRGGTVYFHDNPKLCLSEIEKFAKDSNLKYTEFDVSSQSNGDLRMCTEIELNITVVEVRSTNATFIWENVTATKNIKPPIGYWLCYTANRLGNVTDYEDHQQFYENIWECVFVADITTCQIFDLIPFTEYAYYIRLYSNTIEKDGQTKLGYFKTPADNPSELLDLIATSTASDSVSLNWKLPIFPNGILDHYKLVVYFEKDDESILVQRNFCKYPFHEMPDISNVTSAECCSASPIDIILKPKKKSPPQFTCDTLNMEMTHDPRHGACKNYMFPEDKYAESSGFVPAIPVSAHNIIERSTFPRNSSNVIEMTIKDATITSYTIKPLKHFSMFIFLLKVCHKDRPTECSSPVMAFQRTLPKEDADDIPPGFSVIVTDDTVLMKWSEPKQPNSMIFAYQIEYTRTDQENFTAVLDCITRDDYVKSNHNFQIVKYPPGHYGIRVRAVSLAGPGRFTPYVNFEIPKPPISLLSMISLTIGIIGTIIAVLIAAIYFRQLPLRRRQDSTEDILMATYRTNQPLREPSLVQDTREINFRDIEFLDLIQAGAFITAHHGMIKSRRMPCLIKTTTQVNISQKTLFESEINVFKWIEDSHFVLKLLGVVTTGMQPFAILEDPLQDLKAYLLSFQGSASTLNVLDMYKMAAEIADGMAFLSSKGIVHKDLAARNCVVFHDKTVKVGDYGISKDIYKEDYYNVTYTDLIPIRWMSPERLTSNIPISAWDVWSYGVLVWEIVNLGDRPYGRIPDRTVLEDLQNRGGSIVPDGPGILPGIMERCWKRRVDQRTQFKYIVEDFVPRVGQTFKVLSYHLNSREGQHAINQEVDPYDVPGPSRPFIREASAISEASSRLSNYSSDDEDY